jgi:hypothetical protein
MADANTPPNGAAPAAPAAAQVDMSKFVPYDRFQQVVAERNQLQVTLEAQTTETDTWREKAATSDTLASQIEAQKVAHATEIESWQTKSAAYKHGVTDPDLVDLTLWQYGRVAAPEGEAKPEYADWLGALKADPTTLPTSLAGLRDAWAAPAAPAAAPSAAGTPTPVAAGANGAPAGTAQVVSPNAGVVGSAAKPPPGSFAPGSVAKMTTAEYRAYKEAGRGSS